MKRAGRKVALRWRHGAEARGLARWRERIARDKKWQQASRQIVLRWQRGLLAPALCRWSDGCKGQKRLGRAAGGVLEVLVDDIRLVGVFRLRWALELAEALQRELPKTGIRKVRFAADTSAGKA